MDKDAIKQTLEDYATAYCAKDIDALMAVFVDGEGVSLIGTGADELCAGREAVAAVFMRNFAEASAQRFEWHWFDIVVSNDSAVVAITLSIHLEYQGENMVVPIRWTVALRRETGRWAWVHRHASSAASSQEEGSAYPQGKA